MFDYEGMSNKMHYQRVLEYYNDICQNLGVEKSEKVLEAEAIEGSYSVKYAYVRSEFKKLVNENVLPMWEGMLPIYFSEKDAADAREIMYASIDVLAEDGYDILAKNFRTLNYIASGHVKDVKTYVGNDIRYMTIDEIICHYDFLLHSKFGNEILDGILEEVKTNPQIAPEVKAYFAARLQEKELQEKIARKQAKKAAKRGEPQASEKQ
jgi:hypothetical protein